MEILPPHQLLSHTLKRIREQLFILIQTSSAKSRDTFSSCSSPETLTSLPLGQHNFHVRVIDPNANKTPKSADFAFNIIPSVIIKGVLLVNGSPFRDTKLMMDYRFNHTADSSGQFNFVNINILKDMEHNFTIFSDAQGNSIYSHIYEPISSKEAGTVDFGPIELGKPIGSTSPLKFVSSEINKVFKPEQSEEFVRLDLLYNQTLIRMPSDVGAKDGIWSITAYVDGPALSNITGVTYYLHPTFKPDVITCGKVAPPDCSEKNNFALHLLAYGGFKLYAKVHFNDGKVVDFSRYLLTPYYTCLEGCAH